MVRIKIDNKLLKSYPRTTLAIKFVLNHLQMQSTFEYTLTESNEDILIADDCKADFQIAKRFYANYEKHSYNWRNYFDSAPVIITDDGMSDYLCTSFYLMNAIQEYAEFKGDKLNRFTYNESLQKAFKVTEENLVEEYLSKILQKISALTNDNFELNQFNSRICYSHDIDGLNTPLLQNLKFVIFKKSLKTILNFIKQGFNGRLFKLWDNIGHIIELEKKNDINSTFFWITETKSFNKIENADYNFNSPKLKTLRDEIINNGGQNGLHKSSNPNGFKKEILHFQSEFLKVNRYHYLKFQLKKDFTEIENQIHQDHSLGFSETIGFRNNYGRPLRMFNPLEDKSYSFLQVPLTIMDRTLKNSLSLSPELASKKIQAFLLKHSKNAIVSILWHNNFFAPFKYEGWELAYLNTINFAHSLGLKSITPIEIEKEFNSQPNTSIINGD